MNFLKTFALKTKVFFMQIKNTVKQLLGPIPILQFPDLPDHLVGKSPFIVIPGHHFTKIAIHYTGHF
jgi:hypothetical protein